MHFPIVGKSWAEKRNSQVGTTSTAFILDIAHSLWMAEANQKLQTHGKSMFRYSIWHTP